MTWGEIVTGWFLTNALLFAGYCAFGLLRVQWEEQCDRYDERMRDRRDAEHERAA